MSAGLAVGVVFVGAVGAINRNISRYVDTTEPVEVTSVEDALAQLREAERRRDEAAAKLDELPAEMGYARDMTMVVTMIVWVHPGVQERSMAPDSNAANTGRTMKASEFKARCLKLMDEVAENGEEIVITKNGRPTARLVAYREKARAPFGRDRDIIQIHGDIVAPMPAEWFESSGDDGKDLF